LSSGECLSLGGIVVGVLISTIGSSSSNAGSDERGMSSTATIISVGVMVMLANFCFSFRGLQQKLFRSTPQGNSTVFDDLNLQYRMQYIGVSVFIMPTLIYEGPAAFSKLWLLFNTSGIIQNRLLYRYVGISIINGFAFAGYNLASTFTLSRISVVHHAALNCVRRIFAIVVTSIAFGVPITFVGAIGIFISFLSFLSYTRLKMKQKHRPRPVSSLLPMSIL